MILKIKSKVDKVIEYTLVVLMSLMVFNVLWQVFTRFVADDPSSFTDELARFLLIWLGLVGAGYVAGRNMHLAIDYFAGKMSHSIQKVINIFVNSVVFLFALIALVIGGISLVSLTLELEQTSAALQVPLGYVYLALPISGILIMFYSAVNIDEIIKNGKL
ncbi:MAG: TRAP transporter small permease [Melioribacteraceae bacterium]|nr:TRAP transporter small permease [Melioribacteraceae bacterium]